MASPQNVPPGPVYPMWVIRLMQAMPFKTRPDSMQVAMDTFKRFGDFACMRVGHKLVFQISNPEIAHQVLVTQADQFHKDDLINRSLRPITGNGLLLSEDDFWRKQRKLAQPAFHHKRIEAYATAMVEETERVLATWQTDQPFNVMAEMTKLALNIVARTMFSADVSDVAARVSQLASVLLEAANNRVALFTTLYDLLPTPNKRQEKQALQEIDALLSQIIRKHRARGTDNGDLLSMLLAAKDEDGNSMSDQQLRDEVITIFLAGHETTAVTLAWAWALLAQNPDVEAKLWAELDSVLGGRPPTLADLANLPYTEMIIKEAMRLYPPAGGLTRTPLTDIQVGEYVMPKGSNVFVSTHVMHRDPRYFPEPEKFIPERFSKEREADIPRYAYIPFGAGPRICIGNAFAMLEARLLLATIAQRFKLSLVEGHPIVPELLFTIRPKYGVQVVAKVRQPALAPA
ncbi:MAG: cytochrome P450 [Chloroflexi bacterium CFX4]|nr:cytochrome P450 [Chloroflexi bacterium CFX4]MDL1924001.1 cytochrome P450 [Chloroflexi bacterium CFX3]